MNKLYYFSLSCFYSFAEVFAFKIAYRIEKRDFSLNN